MNGRSLLAAAMLFGTLVAPGWAAAQAKPGLAVFARETVAVSAGHDDVATEIFAMDAAGHLRQVTHDGVFKRAPVISPDGTRIAYVRPGTADAAAHLVVVDMRGGKLLEQAIQPRVAGVAYLGHMDDVDRVEWLGDGGKIAVRGWINPSQAHFYVVDSRSGDAVADFVDDNGYYARDTAAAFSSDGAHFAYVAGLPHFSGLVDGEGAKSYAGRPALAIDYQMTAMSVRPYRFVTPLAWSPARNSVAAVIQDSQSRALSLVVADVPESAPAEGKAHFRGALHVSEVPVEARNLSAPLLVEWRRDGGLFVTETHGLANALREAWVFDAGRGRLRAVTAEAVDAVNLDTKAARGMFERGLEAAGVPARAADIWLPGEPGPRRRADLVGGYVPVQ